MGLLARASRSVSPVDPVFTGGDPSTNAASIIAENREALVLGENFSGLQFGEVQPQQTFGGVVSFATIPYAGVWTDSQASFELAGLLWVAVRQDGSVLAMTTEATPPNAWVVESFATILDGTLNSFAGTG